MDELITKRDAIGAVNDVLAEYIPTFRPWQERIPLECALKIKALPTVQPKQTNCEYCHTDRDGYVFPLEKNSHAFIDRDKIVLKANGWRGEAKIKYCPICGRRLADE